MAGATLEAFEPRREASADHILVLCEAVEDEADIMGAARVGMVEPELVLGVVGV